MRRHLPPACSATVAATARSLLLLALCAGGVRAQAIPGSAPGSQTGDSGSPYAGLASAPEADLFTGAAQTSIPIQVPPGRLGVAPTLTLTYSSSAGPSAYGYGWSLPLARIHRSLKNGSPHYDGSDTFVLAMPGSSIELEVVPGSPGNYRPRIESTFPRIGFSAQRNLWRVVDKSGVTFAFGSRPGTRLGRGDTVDQTFAWLLESIEDPAGNTIEFSYRESKDGALADGLPLRIAYGGNVAQSMPAFAEVRFDWQPLPYPSRPSVSLRSGFPEFLDSRLASVETFVRGLPARRYDFSHEIDPVAGDSRLVGVTLRAFAADSADDVRLPSTVFAYAPAVQSGWTTGAAAYQPGSALVLREIGPLRLGGKTSTADTLDVNGDAIVDFVDVHRSPATVRLGTGTDFAAAVPWGWPGPPAYPEAPRWIRRMDSDGNIESNVFDLDGDGFADLVDTRSLACGAGPGRWCLWRGSASGFAAEAVAWRAPGPLLRVTRSSGSRVVSDLVDLNGDGYLDYVDSSDFADGTASGTWKVYWNDGHGFASTADDVAAPLPFLARWNDGRLLYGIFDLNADALPDLVSADPGAVDSVPMWSGYTSWQVYLGTGTGFSAAAIEWPIESTIQRLPGFINLRADDGAVISDLLDINGDGRPDLIRRNRSGDQSRTRIPDVCSSRSRCPQSDGQETGIAVGYCCYNLLVYINTGASFASPVPWTFPANALRASNQTCPFTGIQCALGWLFDYDLFDFNGDGLIDLVERFAPGDSPNTWRVYLHPATPSSTAGERRSRPNLLVAMMNGIGGETLLGYRAASAAPDTTIPFPYWTVVRRELRDGSADGPARHAWLSYRGGRYDASEREMRGFAMVWEVNDIGVTRVREFHQDSVRKSRLKRMTVLARPDCEAADPLDPGDRCSPWRFPVSQQDYVWPDRSPVLLASESQIPFSAGGPVEALRTTTDYAYDGFGNTVRRSTRTPLAATTTVETEFTSRMTTRAGGLPGRYTVNKPVHVTVTEDGRLSPVLERRFDYDWQADAYGFLSASKTCATWNGQTCAAWSVRTYTQDPFGNVVATRSPTGEVSTTFYDEAAVYPVRNQDVAGLVTTADYDPRHGTVIRTVDPSGNRLFSQYDGLGRLLSSWGPGTSAALPLVRHRYAPGSLGEGPARIVTEKAGAAPSAIYFDGLGRTIAAKTLRNTDQGIVTEVSGLRQYNADGTVARSALPFAAAGGGIDTLGVSFDDADAWIETLYDNQGRALETIYPDGSRTRVDRSSPGITVSYDANLSRGSHPGSVTIELFDGLGRRLQRDLCSAPPRVDAPYDCRDGTVEKRESWYYDGLGRVVSTKVHALGRAAGDAVTALAYDGLGNRVSVRSGDAGTWRFEHDSAGRLIASVRPDGLRITSSYEKAGRLRRFRGPGRSSSYRYWNSGPGLGKVRRITTRTSNQHLTRAFEYDPRGHLVAESWLTLVRGDAARRWTARYRYDDLGRRVAIEYPGTGSGSTETVETAFDEFGQVRSLSSSQTIYVADAGYDLHGRLVRIDYGNGISDRVAYEPWSNAQGSRGRLRCLRTSRTAAPGDACEATPQDFQALWYRDYDANGNLLEVEDLVHARAERLHDGRSYRYDAIGRLQEATYGDGSSETFAFDPLGNLLRKGAARLNYDDAGSPCRLTSLLREDGSRGSFTTDFDANGSRIRSGITEYTYDDTLRLSTVTSDGEPRAAFGYDDSGRRLYRYDAIEDSVRYEFGDLVAMAGNSIERMFYFGDRLVATDRLTTDRRSGNPALASRVFVHEDHQGSPRLLTDAAGNPVESARFAAFGERLATYDAQGLPKSTPSSRFGFTGHLEEADSELLFFGSRYYHPASGSFLTLDPAFQFSSPYAYSDGNPVLGNDPGGAFFGLTALELVVVLTSTATFVDSLVQTGDLGHSLTAGISAGFSVYASSQLSSALARPLAPVASTWMQQAASIASEGFQVRQALRSIDQGQVASGVVSIGLLAGSLIGIESVNDPGPDGGEDERYTNNGIVDRGVEDGTRVIEVNGICATRPGCVSSLFTALRENLSVLAGNNPGCVNGCAEVQQITREALEKPEPVRLLCNSFGATKCTRALQDLQAAAKYDSRLAGDLTRVQAFLSGAPLLRPPKLAGVTYQANLFDPVVWVGSLYSVPFRSDVVLGANWWLPAPLLVHHSRLYEKSVSELLGELQQ